MEQRNQRLLRPSVCFAASNGREPMLSGPFSRLLLFALGALVLVLAPALVPPRAAAETVTYTKTTKTVNGLKMTIFTKPTADGGVLRITSSGAFLWFPESGTGKIVRFKTTGDADLFQIPSAGAVS